MAPKMLSRRDLLLHADNGIAVTPDPASDLDTMLAAESEVRMLTDDQFDDGTPNWLPLRTVVIQQSPAEGFHRE